MSGAPQKQTALQTGFGLVSAVLHSLSLACHRRTGRNAPQRQVL